MTAFWGCCGARKPEHKDGCNNPARVAETTTTQDLVERLRRDAVTHKAQGWDGDAQFYELIAAEIERLQAEIARLKEREHDETVRVYGVALQRAEADADRMRDVIEAAKAMRGCAHDRARTGVVCRLPEAFDAALAALEGDK
jgi:hypothetical protein